MAEIFAGGHLRFINGAWRNDNGDPVEIAQVVRCKDCKHTREKNGHEQFMYNENVCICTKEDIWGITKNEPVLDDDFCSYGERKNNGETD